MCGIARFKAIGSTVSSTSSTKAVLALLIDMVPKETWTWAARPPRENEIPMKYILDVDGRIAWRCSDPLAIFEHCTLPSWVLALSRRT